MSREDRHLTGKRLVAECEINVRFSEVDAMKVVWHGHYLMYFEQARMAFGKKYQLEYLDIYKFGYFLPVVDAQCNYLKPCVFGETLKIQCEYIDSKALKFQFNYRVYGQNEDLRAEGKTVQVLTRPDGTLELSAPEFIEKWRVENNL